MKKLSMLYFFSLLSSFGFCQLNPSFEKDTITVERDRVSSTTVHLLVNIKGINTGAVSNAVAFSVITTSPATTMQPADYQFTPGNRVVATGIRQIEWPLVILYGENASGNTLFISVQISYNTPASPIAALTKTVVIKVVNKKENEKEDKDDVDVSLLIGSNLDFFNSVKLKDLAGELNIFIPKIFYFKFDKDKEGINVGANLGIYNYRNFSVDSPGTVSSLNYKLVPFETLDPTKKIVKATFSTTGKSTRDFQGFYVDPIFSLAGTDNRKARLYLSFHFEILKRTEKIEYDNPNYIWRDTVLYNAQRDNVVNEHSNIIRLNPISTYHSSYFGLGFPVSVSKKYFELYFAPTFGISKYNVSRYETKGGSIVTINERGPFYLCKFFFKERVSLLGLTIGGEVRGILGKLNPYLNAYVATRISLSKFSEFFSKTSTK